MEVVDGEVFLFSEFERKVLKGAAYVALAPLLVAGEHGADALVLKLKKSVSPELVYYALTKLEELGFIEERLGVLPHNLVAYCGALGITEALAYERLQKTTVYVQGDTSFLKDLPIRCVDSAEDAELCVVFTRDYADVSPIDKPQLLCKPTGAQVWMGPLFIPGEKGCVRCLQTRLKLNRLEEAYVQQHLGLEAFSCGDETCLPSTVTAAHATVATEIFKWIVCGKSETLTGKIQVLNTLSLKREAHAVIPLPSCTFCGTGRELAKAVVLRSQMRAEDQGGFRCCSAEKTVERYLKQVSPITGVVKFLEPLEQKGLGALHVYMSGTNHALYDVHQGKGVSSFRQSAGGKGTTEAAAKASAICEALERASGVYHGDEEMIQASYVQLKDQALHPHEVMLFSEKQLAVQESPKHAFWRMPLPFAEEAVISWTPLYSMTHQQHKYYPTSCCYFRGVRPSEEWDGFADSNGCAAGNCLEEAILQGFLELVERDSVAIWWYNRLQCPEVDLQSFCDPYIDTLLQEYALKGRTVWVLDITSDLGIPTFVAFSRLQGKEQRIFMGFGAHLEAKIALLRALTEMNQFFAAEPFWEKKTPFGESEQEKADKQVVLDWMRGARFEELTYLQPLGKKQAADYTPWTGVDIRDDVLYCQKLVEKKGMEFLVLDQTRPEIGLSVARVVVPGLRHFWPRYAPGRLYDVPVQMGKSKSPCSEEQLNPIGMFL